LSCCIFYVFLSNFFNKHPKIRKTRNAVIELTRKNPLRASAFIYDVKRESITHIKVDDEWVPLSEIAVEEGVSPKILNQLLSLNLLRRLQSVNNRNVFKEASEFKAQKELNSRIIALISERTKMKPEEVHAFVKAIISNGSQDVNLTDILSVLARRTNIPFRELAKKVMERP